MNGSEDTAQTQRKATATTPADDVSLILHGQSSADSYEIRYCVERRYLQMRLIGVWNEATFDRFAADYRSVVSRLDDHGGIAHSLVDAVAFGLQPQSIADRFPALINATNQSPDRRSACVVPALVNRIQARIGGDLLNARYFRTIEDAADWLFSNEA